MNLSHLTAFHFFFLRDFYMSASFLPNKVLSDLLPCFQTTHFTFNVFQKFHPQWFLCQTNVITWSHWSEKMFMFSCCQENNSPNYCVVHSMPSDFLLKFSNLVVFCCSSAYFLLDTFFSLPKNIPMLFPTQISEKFRLKKIFLLCPLLKSSSSVRLPLSPLCFQYILNISLFLHLIFQIFIKCFVRLDCTLF